MQTHGTTEEDFAQISSQEYANAQFNPYAQMKKHRGQVEQAATPEGRNRYIVEGLPLKTYDCSQITDGYAGLILATEEGLHRLGVAKADCVEMAGYGQGTDPLGSPVAKC
jgi:acetyl-CoA acetyltransferase